MAVVVGALRAELSASIARFADDMGKAADEVSKFSKRFADTGRAMRDTGRNFRNYVTVPVLAFGGYSLKVASDFEAAMKGVEAVSQATGDELKALRDTAADLGLTTRYTATQAAEGIEMLAKNGLKARQILDGAATATLNLAAATGSQLAPAADVMTDIMVNFQKEGAELARIVDNISGTVVNAKLDFDGYKAAAAQAAGVAATAGLSFEDMNAGIAATAPAFASGEETGTSFKTFLMKLVPDTKAAMGLMNDYGLSFFDAAGRMKPLAEIAENLKTSLGDLTEEEQIEALKRLFGVRAIRTAALLMKEGAEGIERFKAEIGEISAAEQAAIRMEGAAGATLEFRSAIEGAAIAIAESGLLQAFTAAVKEVTQWIRAIAQLNPEILKWTTIILGLAAAIGPLLMGLGSLMIGIAAITPTVAMLWAGFMKLGAIFTLVKTGIGLLVLAWPTLGVTIMGVVPAIAAFAAKLAFAGKVIMAMIAGASAPLLLIVAAVTAAVAIWYYWDEIVPIVKALYEGVKKWLYEKLGSVLAFVGDKVKAVTGFFADMYDKVVGNSYVPDMVERIKAEFARLPDVMLKPTEDTTGRTGDAFQTLGDRVGGVFRQMLEDGKFSIDGLIDAMRQLADEMFVNPFFEAAGGVVKGAISSGLSSLSGSFAGFFAAGGRIPAGQWGIAGEAGAELVYGGRHGVEVVPMGPAGGSTHVTVNITTPDAASFRKSEGQIASMLARAVNRGHRNF